MKKEVYISVDIEATGPIPGEYSMYELGACVVGQPDKNCFYEIKLLNDNFISEALSSCGRAIEELKARLDGYGLYPDVAMLCFADWVRSVSRASFDGAGEDRPVFVGFNATFDWMFVNWYFHKFLGRNPLGISGLDIKAYYMGMTDSTWQETAKQKMDKRFLSSAPHTHNALDDATEQAEIFKKMMDFNKALRKNPR